MGYVQRRQLISGAVQLCQQRILRHVQRRQAAAGTAQHLQHPVVGNVQRCQQIAVAVQRCQRRVRRHVQFRQLVVGTVQFLQRRILRYVQRRQRVGAAIQIRQRRKVLDARQVLDAMEPDMDSVNVGDFLRAQEAVAVRIGVFRHIFAKQLVREMDFIHPDIPRAVRQRRQRAHQQQRRAQRPPDTSAATTPSSSSVPLSALSLLAAPGRAGKRFAAAPRAWQRAGGADADSVRPTRSSRAGRPPRRAESPSGRRTSAA